MATSKWPKPITRHRPSISAAKCGRAGTRGWCIFQSSLGADRRSRAARARPVQHARGAHRPREDQRPGERSRVSSEQGRRDRRADAAMGRGDGDSPRHRRHARAARAARLTKKHSSDALEKACEIALSHGCWQLQTLRRLLGRTADKQEPLPFLDEHPIIRPLDDYAAVVARAIHRQADRPSVGEGFARHGWTKAMRADRRKKKALSRRSPHMAAPSSQGSADAVLPPRSGYPLPGCSSAEPGSVSPDPSTVVPPSLFHQEKPHE